MNHRALFSTSWLLLATATGCMGSHDAAVSRSRQSIELAEMSRLYALSSQLLAERSEGARQRELAARATGALSVPFVDASAQPATANNGMTLRAICGVSFVSPSLAVTAAHCVDGTRMDTRQLTVKMFRPTLKLAESFHVAASLSGSYPDYTHERLTEQDGYLVDEFACNLVARCSSEYGGWASCNTVRDAQLPADVALIRCAGTPGNWYGTLPIAEADDPLAGLFLPWKHEIYDVPMDPEDDRFQHYARQYDDPSQNYHYFDRDRDGQEHHQLLSLVSIPFADGTEHHKVNTTETGVVTDLFGCHGTSGSGVALQPSTEGVFELLGPVVRGNHELEGYLCNHSPSYDGFTRDPGSPGLVYGRLDATRAMLLEHETEFRTDCGGLGDAVSARFAPRPCGMLAVSTARAAVTVAPLPLSAQPQSVDADHPLLLDSVPLRAGSHYRVGLWGSCSGDCASLTLSLGGREVLSTNAAGTVTEPLVLGASFVPTESQSGPIALLTAGSGTWTVATMSIVEEGEPLGFDSAAKRADVLLLDTRSADPQPSPVRVEGARPSGFSALIEPQERLIFTRQALLPQQATSIRFKVGVSAALSCGLLSPSGTLLSRLDCSTGFTRFGPNPNAAAFYVENGQGSAATNIDSVEVVSDAMADSDGDEIPDVIDDCPRGPLPPSGELTWSNAGPDLVAVCSPAAQVVTLKPPVLTNTCEPATLIGHVSAVRGRALAEGVLPLTANEMTALLPNGTITATYNVVDQRGQAIASIVKRTHVLLKPTSTCCRAPQRRVLGSSADEVFDYSALEQICAFAGAGGDIVISGSGSNYLTGGDDADHLSAQGTDDVLLGGSGNDYLSVRSTGAVVFGGGGDDTIHAFGADSSTLHGGAGHDVIVGSSGSDTIVPGSGGDWVDAGAGDDVVILYAACEAAIGLQLHGGSGEDTLRTPLSEEALRSAGVIIDGFETVLFDDTLAYLSDCFAEGAAP